jgi:small-conductance mechanosensitive channel
MNTKKLFSILLLLAGETLIIASFLIFGKNMSSGILSLNIVVTTIIYALFFIDILFPMVNFGDKSHKAVGSLGLRWFFTGLYAIIAIVAMFVFNYGTPTAISTQLIIHSILFFLLLLGLFGAMSSAQKVQAIYKEEKQTRNGIEEMKKATKKVQLKLEQIKEIPRVIIDNINDLQEDLRYLSPCDNPEAFEMEVDFSNQMKALNDRLYITPFDNEQIIKQIESCKRIYQERKQLFSTKY